MIRRGEVWVARLNPNQGAEVGKVRPVVVIQADALTDAGVATVVVVPLTTQQRRGPKPYALASASALLTAVAWAKAP